MGTSQRNFSATREPFFLSYVFNLLPLLHQRLSGSRFFSSFSKEIASDIMQDVREVGRPSLGARSPLSISTDSSRRASLRTALPVRNIDPARPSSPRTRLSRKRAASLELDAAKRPRLEDLALDSASTVAPSTADPTRDQVCLCQPDPKIPRPRNGAKKLPLLLCSAFSLVPMMCPNTGCSFIYGQKILSRRRKLIVLCSVYSLPTTLPGFGRCPTPRTCESRNFKNNRRAVARADT